MKKWYSCIGFLAISVFFMFQAMSLEAAGNIYSENFLSRQYCDILNTTAKWDTLSGELKLYPVGITFAGSISAWGHAWHVEISGNYAYVTDDYAGLLVIDITDPTNPQYAGDCGTLGEAKVVAIAGNFAYIADGEAGLTVVDIFNPEAPGLVTNYSLDHLAIGITVAGDYAYVGNMESGLAVFDISEPWNPQHVGTCDTPGFALHVTTCGDYAFVADGDSGLQVIDIADPTDPILVGNYDTPGFSFDVAISGDYAFVSDGDSGLQVVDISNPVDPQSAKNYDLPIPIDAYGIEISGNYAYVADYNGNFYVFDISEPTDPQPAGSYNCGGLPHGVTIAGNYAYVANYAGLQVLQISDPVPPEFSWVNFSPYFNWDIAISGDYAYVAGDTAGLKVIDIKDHEILGLAGSYNTPGYAVAVAVDGDYAFVADGFSGLQVIEITDPEFPALAGHCSEECWEFVLIHGDYLFSMGYNQYYEQALLTIDISDPETPDTVGTYEIDSVTDMAIAGNYAYLTRFGLLGGITVLNILDPSNPQLVGEISDPWFAMGIVISGDYAYVASLWESSVIDISDPTDPQIVGSFCGPDPCSEPTWDNEIAISGDFVYVVDDSISGLQMYDISDPINPAYVGLNDLPPNLKNVVIDGDYAYVAHFILGLVAVQIFDRNFDTSNNIGQSLVIDQSEERIIYTRLTTTQAGTISWEISADNSDNWQEVFPGSGWERVDSTGSDLLWRSTHYSTGTGINPACSNLQIEWLYDVPMIDQIVDVPDDQGLEVEISWSRSAYDTGGGGLVAGYVIGRMIDPGLLAGYSSVESGSPNPGFPVNEDIPVKLSGILEDDWETVAAYAVTGQDLYTATLPTLKDSTINGIYHTIYRVTALTVIPDLYFLSPPDSGYSVDNIIPGVPQNFTLAKNTGSGNQLNWDPCADFDFQYFNVYRGTESGFVPGPGNLVHSTADTAWTDPEYDGWNVHYKITAIDDADNESEAASPTSITGDDVSSIPGAFTLYQNAPNPFNPTTTIRFDLPRTSHVKLCVYNVKGELITILVDRHMTEGRKEFIWTAVDNRGRAVSSGIYFYRLVAGDFVQTKKMVLLK